MTIIIKDFTEKFFNEQLMVKKIAKPTGLLDNSGIHPEMLEAYYSKKSKKMYLVALQTAKNFYEGKSYDGKKTGFSLKQYLEFLKRPEIIKNIDASFEEIIKESNNLEDNLEKQIKHADNVKKVWNLGQKLRNFNNKLFQTDMMSAFDLARPNNSGDNDGD